MTSISDELAWHRQRRTRRELIDKLAAFAHETRGDEDLHEAWCDFQCARGCRPLDFNAPQMSMFLSWYYFVWRPATGEDKDGRELLGPSLIEEFTERYHKELSESELLYAVTAARGAFSFWQVVEVRDGQAILAEDAFTGERRWIFDREVAARLPAPGSLLFAMAVTMDEATSFEACAAEVFPATFIRGVRELRAEFEAELIQLGNEDLQDNTIEVVDLYQSFCHGDLRPVPPEGPGCSA